MIPNKSNFKFQELTPITGVKPYVIRYWETEFSEIAPITSDSGQKLYARKDVEAILRVKNLLFEEKLTIPEAKARMGETASEELPSAVSVSAVEHDEAKVIIGSALSLIREIKARRKW